MAHREKKKVQPVPAECMNILATHLTQIKSNPPLSEHCHAPDFTPNLRITFNKSKEFDHPKRDVTLKDDLLVTTWPVKRHRTPLHGKHFLFNQNFVNTFLNNFPVASKLSTESQLATDSFSQNSYDELPQGYVSESIQNQFSYVPSVKDIGITSGQNLKSSRPVSSNPIGNNSFGPKPVQNSKSNSSSTSNTNLASKSQNSIPPKKVLDFQAKFKKAQHSQRQKSSKLAITKFNPKASAIIPNVAPRRPEVTTKSKIIPLKKKAKPKSIVAVPLFSDPIRLPSHSASISVSKSKDSPPVLSMPDLNNVAPVNSHVNVKAGDVISKSNENVHNGESPITPSCKGDNDIEMCMSVEPSNRPVVKPISETVVDLSSFDLDLLFSNDVTEVEKRKLEAQVARSQLPLVTKPLTDKVEMMDVAFSLFGLNA